MVQPPPAQAPPPARAARLASAESVVPWLVRSLWVGLPFTAGPALASALDGTSASVRTLSSLGLWAGWAVGTVASLVPHPVALTALRVLAPATVVAAGMAAIAETPSALAMAWTVVVAGWVFSPVIGARWVNGPAYPNERRFPLRAPGALLFGPLAMVWVVALAGLCAGPLLLAAGQWIWGALASAAGVPLSALLLRSLNNLSRRWAVFVPAGLVLHDPLTLVDPVLVPRQRVRSLRSITRAGRGTAGTVDLTQGAPGLALELTLTEPVTLLLLRPLKREGESTETQRLAFTPTRPGAVVSEARARRIATS